MPWFLQCAGIMACLQQLQHAQQALNLLFAGYFTTSVCWWG
jgi:hypothetical protein